LPKKLSGNRRRKIPTKKIDKLENVDDKSGLDESNMHFNKLENSIDLEASADVNKSKKVGFISGDGLN
jgi:hypothetical protein